MKISLDGKWPMPRFDDDDQPHFLFVITLPYSGSTALSELLNSSHKTMILQKRGEGQWLIPGLSEKDRWDKDKKINYRSVKAVWLNKYQEVNRLVRNVEVVIEKSPPNMMRLKELSAQFKRCSYLAINRNPHASCASYLYRNFSADELGRKKRHRILAEAAEKWVVRSKRMRKLIRQLDIPLTSYETFCLHPESLLEKLSLPEGVVDSIDPSARVKVKDYQLQPISDQNQRQICKLKSAEIALISNVLGEHEKLLSFFGYRIADKSAADFELPKKEPVRRVSGQEFLIAG